MKLKVDLIMQITIASPSPTVRNMLLWAIASCKVSNPRITFTNFLSNNLFVNWIITYGGKVKIELRVQIYELWVQTSWETKSTNWEIKSTSQEIKSTSWRNKTTNNIVNLQIKKEKSEFTILNFTSYQKASQVFHSLVNAELNPHTKVLRNLFHNIALTNFYVITILPSYFSSRET